MKKNILFTILIIAFFSCKKESILTPQQLKVGSFKSILDKNQDTSYFSRTKLVQIEPYKKQIDTFDINWKSNFEYSLKNKHPKNEIDRREFIIKITGVFENHYTFRAHYKGSNYKLTGKAIRLKN